MTAADLLPGVVVQTDALGALIERLQPSCSGAKAPIAVGYVNAHVYGQARINPWLRKDLEGMDLLLCDGWSIHLAYRLAGLPPPKRHTGADWLFTLAEAAADEGLALGWWGGLPGRVEQAVHTLQTAHPRLSVPWLGNGMNSPRRDRDRARQARNAGVDILILGLGTPRQEALARQIRDDPRCPDVVCCIGGAADVLSGVDRRGPEWMTQNGLEWAWRLGQDPQRHWRRYVLSLPQECGHLAAWSLARRWMKH